MSHSTLDMWEHILTLMTVIVVSDKQVRRDETNSFLKNTHIMADEIDQTLEMSDEVLIRWFEARRMDIAENTAGEMRGSFIVNHLIALEAFIHKQELLNCLINIAVSDSEMHEKEVDVVNLAAAYWGLDPIRATVV